MTHRETLGGTFFGYGGGSGNDGNSVHDQAVAAAGAASHAAQSQEDSMMMFFNDPPYFLDTFDGLPRVMDDGAGDGTLTSTGSMFPPPSALPSNFVTDGTTDGIGNDMGAEEPSPPKDPEAVDKATTTTSFGGLEAGAGPEPITSSGPAGGNGAGAAAAAAAAAASLTEFTRRKNWPAKVIEELRDLLMIIEPNYRIKFASPNLTSILGYTPDGDSIIGQFLSELVHPDDRAVLLSELNACIANATIMRMYYRLRKSDGTYSIVETVGHAHIAASRFAPSQSNKSPFCQAVFLISRPYPTKNACLLDSFLEHKMENERLRRRIDDLRREEQSEDRDDESHSMSQSLLWRQSVDGRFDNVGSDAASVSVAGPHGVQPTSSGATLIFRAGMGTPDGNSMPPPMAPFKTMSGGPAVSLGAASGTAGGGGFAGMNINNANAALTRENLEGIAARRPDSLRDKMARYEGTPGPGSTAGSASAAGAAGTGAPSKKVGLMGTATTADTIEMLTGLRYQEGERSKGLSTGNRSPQLIRGDAGIAFTVNRDQRAGDKKKKMRLAEEYVCTDCGTLESPEWRKGPSGPKTLCNACGLRWAKKEKKEKKKAAVGGGPGSASGAADRLSPIRNWEE